MSKHITFDDLYNLFIAWNKCGMSNPLKGVIVYKADNWPDKQFSLESRSYVITSDAKYFHSDMCGNSLFGTNLTGEDYGVRLDWYNWKKDYCYIIEG